jgi:hypothetical protein
MDVFNAFAGAVVSGVYSIGSYQRGSLEGNQFTKISDIDVIIDESDIGMIGRAPNAEVLDADLLLYVKPSQLPTLNPRALTAGYMIYDSKADDYFAIIHAMIGKNQHSGQIEHVELLLRQTEATL